MPTTCGFASIRSRAFWLALRVMNKYQHWKDLGRPTGYLMDCWLAAQSDDPVVRKENEWALMEPVDDAMENPEKAWEYILFAVRDPRFSDCHLGTIAAGALEDLLSHHGPVFIERVEHQAKKDQRFAWMLGGIWKSQMNEEIWSRVKAVWDQPCCGASPTRP